VPIDRKQLPQSAEVLQQMVLDLIAQLDASEARRIKTENLLRQLLAARSGRRSEQISDEQLALFEAALKAQGVNVEEILRPPRDAAPRRTLADAAPCPVI
jgi:hypothetical protein